MNIPIQLYGPAKEGDATVFGSSRPSYPSRRVSQAEADAWIKEMVLDGMKRVVCLLAPAQLSFYPNLLGTYRTAFGTGNVLSAPIGDYSLAGADLLKHHILPFIKQSIELEKKVLVHCSAGCGRTGFVLAAYLVSLRGFSNEEAIAAVAAAGRDARESGDPRVDDILDECRLACHGRSPSGSYA